MAKKTPLLRSAHALGPVVVAGDDAHLHPQLYKPGKGPVKEGDGFGRGYGPVVYVPAKEKAGGLFPLYCGQQGLF